jgi:GT2 family glycosyltransferase
MEMALFEISVVICTYNRCEMLNRTILPSLETQVSIDPRLVEVIIIDNASTDLTFQVSENYLKQSKFSARYIYESQPGISHARNRGAKEANAEIVAYVDDDISLTTQWLATILEAYRRYPESWAIGGKTIPVGEAEPVPKWFGTTTYCFLGGHDLGDEDLVLTRRNFLHGANMSIRKKAFEKYGLFNLKLGVVGSKKMLYDEGEFFWRILKNGGPLVYVPKATAYHHIPAERLDLKKLQTDLYLGGYSEGLVDLYHFSKSHCFIRFSRRVILSFVVFIIFPLFYMLRLYQRAYLWYFRFFYWYGYIRAMLWQLVHGSYFKDEVN